jgi:hypothetical protein
MFKKKYKVFILLGVVSMLFSNCSTVKKAFDPERKNSTQEFLVEKKLPLSMPPDFNELAVPQINNKEIVNQDTNIEYLINQSKSDDNQENETENEGKEFELIILDKIKNN